MVPSNIRWSSSLHTAPHMPEHAFPALTLAANFRIITKEALEPSGLYFALLCLPQCIQFLSSLSTTKKGAKENGHLTQKLDLWKCKALRTRTALIDNNNDHY